MNNASINSSLNLPGYILIERLYIGSRTVVYRAQTVPERQPVVIKILRQTYPSFNEIVQFRNQYAITKNLDIPGIVRPLSLEPWQNAYALVMPDNGSISLAEYAKTHELDINLILCIALRLTETLHHLHGNRVIHKDIKPANILIQPQTQQVQLSDFSISSLLPKETQQLQNPNVLEGTLAYIAPEQTGRMNRGIDYRTDFYSLGVMLYELLTRQLPFETNDPLDLVHAHIAQIPPPPHERSATVPPGLSAVVLKLMEKNAENRYQSALGLQFDLQECWKQWQETGQIIEFELGRRDLCDRFTIPEKLYGREPEVQTLLNAFERVSTGSTEMMLVAGFSGIGKTAVINEVHKPITRQRGYFIKGKFDQFNRNLPLSAFVEAFRDLMGQLLSESDAGLQIWKSKILAAVGDNGQVLIEVIPELERIIGEQSPVPELSGGAAQNRFNLLFQKFIAVFANREHPLVLFLDDLQWADSASLPLIKLLMEEKSNLLLLGAYRDNEVSPVHPFILTVEELKKANKPVSTIVLAPLTFDQINQLVADTLHCSLPIAQPLSALLDRKTKGNPFFLTQFLKALHEEGQIIFNREQGYWECDLARIKALSLTEDVVEFMAIQLQKLPPATQQLLKLAACTGNQFDLATLAIISEQSLSKTAVTLWKALQEGFIIPQSEIYKFYLSSEQTESTRHNAETNVYYRFLHDRVQQAAYSLIPASDKASAHYRIGQLLLQKISPEIQEERIFEIVNQLNYGTKLIPHQKERDELAYFNQTAARKARWNTTYQAGREYAETGIDLLGEAGWERQYKLCLELHELAADLAMLCGDFEAMQVWIETVIERAHSFLEQIPVSRIGILSKFARNQLTEAITIACSLLEQLGLTFPETITPEYIYQEVAEIRDLTANLEVEDLLNLPVMTDPQQTAIVQISSSVLSTAFLTGSPLFSPLGTSAVKLSLQSGNTSASALSYVCYAISCCIVLKSIETAAKFGELSLKLVEKLDARDAKPTALFIVGTFIRHRTAHIRESLPILQDAYVSASEVGNLEYVGLSAHLYCLNSFWGNQALESLAKETKDYYEGLTQLKQITSANYCRMYYQTMFNLLELTENPAVLDGEAIRESDFLPRLLEAHDYSGLVIFYLYKLLLSYLFEDLELAKQQCIAIAPFFIAGFGTVAEPAFYFYHSLTILADLSQNHGAIDENSETWQQINTHHLKLQQEWASSAPFNYQHKVDLIVAEKCRVLGQMTEAIELYDRAIAGAKANGYMQEQALANELAAKFYLTWSKEKVAAGYMQEAYYCYARWGAKAKVDALERRYPQLLQPILVQQAFSLSPLDTLESFSQLSQATLTQNSVSKNIRISETLDLASVLKAAQIISNSIELDDLLQTLSQIILTSSGAEKCILLFSEADEWQIRALSTPQATELLSQPLGSEITSLPLQLIRYVKNTQEMVVVNDLQTDLPVVDDYVLRQQPQSLLCLPILCQSDLMGIVYLQNQHTSGAFTKERILVLNFLSAQIGISWKNAQLYRQAQQALADLQHAQLQIVQSEKMSALGNLVSGVAHEINNPVGFIAGNLTETEARFVDVVEHLNLYQSGVAQVEIDDHAEEIDIEYILADFPKMLASMKMGCDRINNISKSLRTFSRADREYKVSFQIEEGIESTLMILKHRLKANDQRPAIEVVKDYGEIPEIECFPGQLNQVFMNLLANAIDALDEAAQQHSYQELEAQKQQIFLQTALNESGNAVEIRIRDNAMGIPESLQSKIFEHLFTTKGVGKGTGLGLAIARQIVVEKHGGTIEVRSFTASASPLEIGRGTEFCIRLPLC